MIKRIIKILLTILLILSIAIFYLSFFGIKTDKFNNQISNNILKINKKINLSLNEVNYLLNPYNFTINIKTNNPQILVQGRGLKIKNIQTNVALKSFINNQFSFDDLQITTKEIKLNDIIKLARVFKDSPKLFALDGIIKDGLVTVSAKLNFDEKGKIKENYKIEGFIKKTKINIFNKFKLQNLNLNFNIENNIYSLKQIEMNLNDIKITSPLIKVEKNKNLFFVKGQFLNDKKNFNYEELKPIFANLFKDIDFQKIEFSSKNNFSFYINNKLKFNNLKMESFVYLNKLIFKKKYLRLKAYLPNFVEEINLQEHKIIISYDKDKFDIKGNGNFLLKDRIDSLSYQIIKNKNNVSFDSKIKLNNSPLLLDFLDYEKKEKRNSLISVKGNINKNNNLSFDVIALSEHNNEILIKGLDLNKSFKIIDIDDFNLNYKNNKKILNKLNLKKDGSDFIIDGVSFDASSIINNIMDNDGKSSSYFESLNSKIKIRIKKTYIDRINYINDLYGEINFLNNKINNLELESEFQNKKEINLSIKTDNNLETITKLSTSNPKPLIKRYKFIKGFEEGYLDFYSSKRGNISNSLLIIDNFKVKEVPIFAKLLSLASLQGIADLLTGEGIRFTDLEMKFSNKKGLITIEEMYAIGPAVSILMDGYIESRKLVSLRGT